MKSLPYLISLTGLVSAVLVPLQAASTVYSDDFESYATNAELKQAYPRSHGSQPILETERTLADGKAMKIANGNTIVSLDTTVDADWSLSFDVIHTSYSRYIRIGLLNEEGTNGYIILWSSATADTFNGEGHVSIERIEKAPTNWNDKEAVTNMTRIVASGHPAVVTGDPTPDSMAKFKLTWTESTGELKLYVDDELVSSVVDTQYKSFSNLFIEGNTTQLVDNIQLELTKD